MADRISVLSHDQTPSNVLPILSRNPSLQAAIRAIDVETRSESVIRVGTRASALALVQANLVLDALQELAATETCPAINPEVSNTSADFPEQSASPPLAHPWANAKQNGLPNGHPPVPVPQLQFKLAPMSVAGDRNKIEPLYLMGAKALWTKDLEVALVDGVVDCIVHSLKDVPTSLPDGCEIAAVMPREDPRDALIVKAGQPWKTLAEMPKGSCIGSSSVRRVAQMRRHYPHLVFKDVRGNIDTRLKKLDAEDGPYDALILASAGLIRTQQAARITDYLSSPTMLHAVGQGAIGIEIRSNDVRMKEMVSKINDRDTFLRTRCEREMLHVLEGGCSVPVGVETSLSPPSEARCARPAALEPQILSVRAIIASLDGQTAIEYTAERPVTRIRDAEQLGHDVALVLIQRGGKAILEELGRIVEMKNVNGINGGQPVQGVDEAVAQEHLEEMRQIDQAQVQLQNGHA